MNSGDPVRLKHLVGLINEDASPDCGYVGLEHVESWTGKYTVANATDGTARAFRPGDVMFGKLRPYLAKAFVAREAAGCSSELLVLRPGPRLHAEFLAYVVLEQGFVRAVDGSTFGAKMPRANWDFIGDQRITLPPLPTQKAIAAFLDRKTAAIDALIEKKQKLLDLLAEKRAALINQAVTKGLDPNVPMKDSGIPWIGEIPAHWELRQVKRFARPGRKTFTDGDWIETPYITDEGVRLIQTGNVGTGDYREKGFRYVSDDTFRDLKCVEVEPGDLLICRLDGPVGRACLAPDLGVRMITSVDNAILKTEVPRHDPRYLVYLMNLPERLRWLQTLSQVGGGHRWRISRTGLGELHLPSPPGAEQRRICDWLEQAAGNLERIRAPAEGLIECLQEYRQALITAAVTGQLDLGEEAAG